MSAPKAKERHRRRNEIETQNLAAVQDAVRDYRVIEDGAFAHSLQEREIEYHYSQNVNMRRTVQDDIRAAKELQDEEDRKAKIRTLDEEEEVKQMDEELAEMIQEQIFTEGATQEREKKEWVDQDKELALLLEEKERRKAVEHARRNEERDYHLAIQMERATVTSPDSEDGRRMRVMSDKELARRLQDEENLKLEREEKHKKQLKSAVELQDEELAKYIHERDIEKAEYIYRKDKKKMKGQHRNEPLYYDDNIDPPDYRAAVNEPEHRYSNERRSHRDDRRPGKHGQNRSYHDQRGHEKSHTDDQWDRPRRYPPQYDDHHGRSHGHSSRNDERHEHSRGDPERKRSNERPRSEHKPSRPPPPKFDSHHATEVKEPLDSHQVHNRERNRQQRGRSSEEDLERNRKHDQRSGRGHNDRRDGPSNPDDRHQSRPHRSYSEKDQKATPNHSDKKSRQVDDLQYSEDFVELANEEINKSRKQRKSQKSDCKQQ